jgi:hypothetical protein
MIYISIGDWCGTRISFRQLFNLKSYPFDNITTPDLKSIIYLVENNFKNFLEYDEKNKKKFINNILNITFPHDNLDDNCEINKYQRRIDRFYEYLLNDEIICFVRTSKHNNVFNSEEKDINKFCNLILEKNPKKRFWILLYNITNTQLRNNLLTLELVNILHDIKFENKKELEYKLKMYNINLQEIKEKIEIKNIDTLLEKYIDFYIKKKKQKPSNKKKYKTSIKYLKNIKKQANELYN